MAKQLVLVVRQTFAFKGAHLNPGDRVTDPDDVATILATHPEKVIRTAHDVPDAPAAAEPTSPAQNAPADAPHA